MISRQVRTTVARAVTIALGLAAAKGIYAADNNAGGDVADELPQIVVTATKRESTVQSTAASITAVSADDIAERGLVDFNALAESVPGISMRTGGPGQTEFEMRGLNSAGGNTSMVGFYLDETPLSSPASAQLGKVVIDPNLYDLNRVEVLRGPQGTLYGASSMGGTVKLIPNAPALGKFEASGETVFSATASGGGINIHQNGMVNLPIGDSIALRIVASTAQDSGWIKRDVIQDGAVAVDAGTFPNVFRPANFYTAPLAESVDGANSTRVETARASLLWKPIDSLTITPMLMYQRTEQDAPSAVDVNLDPTHPTVPAVNAHYEIYDSPEPQLDRFTLGSLKAEYTLPWFTITSATGDWNRNTLVSQDGSEENAAAIGIPVYDTAAGGVGPTGPSPQAPGVVERDYTYQFSEELRFTSNGSGPFQWIVGYYYQDLHSYWDEWSLLPYADPAILGGENVYVDYQPQVITQNAEFGEASYQFTPDLKATVGLRHYHYSLSQSNEEYGAFTVFAAQGNAVPFYTAASNQASGTNPKFDLSYNVSKDVMVYATAARGFRLGGVNQPIPVASSNTSTNAVLIGNECSLQSKLLLQPISSCNPNTLLQAPATFSSDTVWNYEIGEKAALLDHRLIANFSGYYERWTNPQLATNLAGFGLTANGGNARIYGIEGQVQALVAHDLNLTINAGYTNAKFSQNSAITGYPSGYDIPDTPSVTASGILSYKHSIGNNLSLTASIEGDYVGTRTDAPYGETITLVNINQYLVHLPAYAIGNFRLGVASDSWTASLFVNNFTNTEALLDPQPQINLQLAAFARYIVNPPLTGGIDVSYKFH